MNVEIDTESLADQLEKIQATSQAILDFAKSEGRDYVTESENAELERLDALFTTKKIQLENQIQLEAVDLPEERENTMSLKYYNQLTAGQGRKSVPDDVVKDGSSAVLARANGEFRSFGDFAQSVYSSQIQGRSIDPRLLKNAPTTTSTEGVGADGGYGVPPDYKSAIMQEVLGETSLLSLTDQHTTPSNEMHFPADETAPWDTTNGVQAYWESEARQLTQSKVALKDKTIKLNKLTALIPVTSELLEDSPSLNAYLSRKVPEKFISKLNTAIVSGTGVGEPQGILNCPSLVSIAAESGQSADTIVCSLG